MQCWKSTLQTSSIYTLVYCILVFDLCLHFLYKLNFFLIRKYGFPDIDLANSLELTSWWTDRQTGQHVKKQICPTFSKVRHSRDWNNSWYTEVTFKPVYVSHCQIFYTHVNMLISWYHLVYHCQIFNISFYTLVLQKMAQKQNCRISSHYLAKSVLVWTRMGPPILPCCDGDCRSGLRPLSLMESGGHLTQYPW